MTIRVVEVHAAAAVQVIDLTWPFAAEVRIEHEPLVTKMGKRRVELHIAYQESAVIRLEMPGVDKVDRDAIACPDGHERAPLRSRLESQNRRQKFRRRPFFLCRNNDVIELDTHVAIL